MGRILAALAIGSILALTLAPGGGTASGVPWTCVACGHTGVADALRNILLFVPLGAALAPRGSWRRALLAGAALSVAVETAQSLLPGRYPTLGDVLFNTLGAGGGWLLVRRIWPAVVRPPASVRSRGTARRIAAAGAAAAAAIAATAALLSPTLPASTWYGQWTPRLGHLERYDGRVLSALVGDHPLPEGELPDAPAVREALARGDTLRVTFVAGPATAGLAPIFSIFDEREREILLVGADGSDLVLRYRTRASGLRLDQPDIRRPEALGAAAPGDTLVVAVHGAAGGYCLGSGGDGRGDGCGGGPSLARGWALLLYPEWVGATGRAGADLLWLGALFVPVGLWMRGAREALAAATITILLLVLLPAVFGLAPTPLVGILGAALGVGAGALLGRR